MKAAVKDRQTVLDIALQTGGTLEAAMALALSNGISITEVLEEGQELTLPEAPLTGGEARTVAIYRARGVEPATEASTEDVGACPYGGIGFMEIEKDFTVS